MLGENRIIKLIVI